MGHGMRQERLNVPLDIEYDSLTAALNIYNTKKLYKTEGVLKNEMVS